MSTERKFRFHGGPFNGWTGEFTDTGQDVVMWGPDGGQSFAYVRVQSGATIVTFTFDVALTRAALTEAGLSPAAIDLAVATNSTAAALAAERLEDDWIAGHREIKANVEVRRDGAGWVMYADGELVAEREDVADADDAKAWVDEVMVGAT